MKKAITVALVAVAVAGCSIIVRSDARPRGIGATCASTSECQAGTCDNGVCVATCASNTDCPAPSMCFSGKCQVPLKVGALWVGVVAGGEGWTLTHQEGMDEAAKALPYLSWSYKENIFSDDLVASGVDEMVKGGAEVIVANSFSQRNAILKKADEYPKVKFLTCASYKSNGKNAVSYTAHSEQTWYIAGKVAATKTVKNRLGYVGSFITPEVVRHIGAFLLGARSVKPEIEVEVQWLGFWYDYKPIPSYTFSDPNLTDGKVEKVYREELLTYRLIQDGCDVVAHGADNQRAVRLVERLAKEPGRFGKIGFNVWSLSNDNRNGYRELTADQLPNGPPMRSCLGSPYWSWGPMYARLFDAIHRDAFDPNDNPNDRMLADPRDSTVGFNLNPNVGVDDSAVRGFVSDVVSRGWEHVFQGTRGAYATTGQRDKDGDGKPDADQTFKADELMSEDEYTRLCWFPRGVRERAEPEPGSLPAVLIDARVPDQARVDGDPKWIGDVLGPPGAPPKVGLNCNENL
jgi:simple sugar transport system substrate-binding protein